MLWWWGAYSLRRRRWLTTSSSSAAVILTIIGHAGRVFGGFRRFAFFDWLTLLFHRFGGANGESVFGGLF
uniref:Uncharacterized protein n=1 Tax=Anopheles minimus TaxID=112268 RepID=A0A182WF70_9DIPT